MVASPVPKQPPKALLIGSILFLALAYSAAVGVALGMERLLIATLLIALPAAVLAALLAIRYFRFCVVVLPLAVLLVQIDLPTGTSSVLPLSLVLVLALTLIWCCSMTLHGWRLLPSPLNRPLLVFSAICAISLPWGIVWRDPTLIDIPKFIVTQVGSLVSILMSMGAALLVANFVQTRGQLKVLLWSFLIVGSIMTFSGLLGISVPLLRARGLWAMWLLVVVCSIGIAQPRLHMAWRAALMALTLPTLYLTMIKDALWLSGWVPSLIALLVVAFLRSRRLFLLLLLVGALAMYQNWSFFVQVSDDNVAEGGTQRIGLWEQNLRVVGSHWLFGTGPAGYAIYYMSYYREDARSTHNNYLDILSQFGVAGMAAWVWLSVAVIWHGWRICRQAPPGIIRTTAIAATSGWVGALASMMLGDWVLPFAYNQGIGGYQYTVYTWLFLGALIACGQMLHVPAAASTGVVVEADDVAEA